MDRPATAEDVLDAQLEGDRSLKPGSARAALSYPMFRRVYFGSLGSNVGTWMQNVVLTAYAWVLTGDPAFVALMGFVQLGPLALSPIGGTIADRYDRRRLLMGISVFQAFTAMAPALVTLAADPNRLALLGTVFVISLGQAVNGPTFSATLPTLVRAEDLSGAVSLTSANMNVSRVLGSMIGPAIYAGFGVSWVFALNGLTYFFIVVALWTVRVPSPTVRDDGLSAIGRVLEGFRIAKRDRIVVRILTTVAVFSFCSLIFITQMPTLAEEHLGVDPESGTYGLLFASFGLGAVVGALSVGSVFVGRRFEPLVRINLVLFALLLAVWTLNTSLAAAFPIGFALGIVYFIVITVLSTALQSRIANATRGRIMALWIMCYGGTVPIGNLVAGPIINATSLTAVLVFGAAVAVALSFYARGLDEPAPAEVAAELNPAPAPPAGTR